MQVIGVPSTYPLESDLVDSTIHPLNIEPAPEKDTEAVKSFNNMMDIQGEVGFERTVRSLHILNPSALL